MQLNPHAADAGEAAAIVIAVKPQAAAEAIPASQPLIGAATVVVSIMAGRTLQFLAERWHSLRPGARHAEYAGRDRPRHHSCGARATPMPRSASWPIASCRATGAVEWIDDEALMDAVTAVSGSGPAYVFLLAEALAQAGVAAGLPPRLAAKLARETVAGSGELLHRSDARCRDVARECDVARRHHRGGACSADGPRRPGTADGKGGRGRDRALARACRLIVTS